MHLILFSRTSLDDYCVKILILKMLYLIFSTNGTSEYFYTNDLCVLMDVFLRELADLDVENESICFHHIVIVNIILTFFVPATAYVSQCTPSFAYEDSTATYMLAVRTGRHRHCSCTK